MSFIPSPLCGNFLMLRTPVTIDGKPAQAVCDKGWLTLSTGSPNTGVTFDSFIQDIDEVLKNHNMEGISNCWCEDIPLFQVKTSSEGDIKRLLNMQEKIKEEIASRFAAKLAESLPMSNPPPTPHVEVCPEVYVMIPDYRRMNGKFIPVTKETLTSCMSLCAENGLLDFGICFGAWYTNPTWEDRGPESILQLENDLKEVDDWFHLGMQIGVPQYKLKCIQRAYQYFPEQCRSDMLQFYMQNIMNKKWLTIVQALHRIGQRTLATKIALKYGITVPQVNKPTFMEQRQEATIENELKQEINKLTKQIAEKDMKLDKQEQALEQAKQEERALSQKLTEIKEKKKKAEEKTEELKSEKTRLEVTLQHKEKEIQSLKQSSEKNTVLLLEMIAMKEKECEGIKTQLQMLERELNSEKERVSKLQNELQTKLSERDQEIQHLRKSSEEREEYIKQIIAKGEQQLLEHKEQLKKIEEELESQKKENVSLQKRFQKVTMKFEKKKVEARKLHESKEEIRSKLKQEREKVDMLLRESVTVKACHATKTEPFSLKWRRGKDLPFRVEGAHTVVRKEEVYIGGGLATEVNEYIVIKYDPKSEKCSQLPQSNVNYFAMASVKDQLLLVGGVKNSAIQLFDSESHQWTSKQCPRLPMGRSSLAAVSYKSYLMVACGYYYKDTVDVLDCSTHQWYSAQPVPVGGHVMTTVIINDYIYISSHDWSDNKPHVFSAHLPTLISIATHHTTTGPTWQELPSPPIDQPTLLALQNHLLLVGGGRKQLYRYEPEEKRWSVCGQLPVRMYAPSCAVLPSGELFVAGGKEADIKGQQVWIGSLE